MSIILIRNLWVVIKSRLLIFFSLIILISDPVSINIIISSFINFIIIFRLAAQQNMLLFLTNFIEFSLNAFILISIVLLD